MSKVKIKIRKARGREEEEETAASAKILDDHEGKDLLCCLPEGQGTVQYIIIIIYYYMTPLTRQCRVHPQSD